MTRRLAVLLAILLLGGGWLASPTPSRALVSATVTVTMSPNPSVSETTIKIVIKFAAPVTNIRFWLYRQGGYHGQNICTPECHFYTLYGSPTWEMASASGTVTATYLTDAAPGATDIVYHDGFAAESVTLREKYPTITTTLKRSPTGVVMPGDTIHVTVQATTNAGPLTSSLLVWPPDTGVGEPTNLPDGASYHPPPTSVILVTQALDNTGGYGFDIPITAPVGTKLVFKARFEAYGSDTTMSLTVGVAATPHPTATPRSTKTPSNSPRASAVASAGASDVPSPPVPEGSPSASAETPSSASSSPSASPSIGAPQTTLESPAAPDVTPTSEEVGSGFALGLVVVLGVGLSGLAALRLASRSVSGRGRRSP